uniref:Uncharacterized protein n=1 Tax=Sander lucioperca TaxID=283035 RepID=A0A8D0ABE3_SANLU
MLYLKYFHRFTLPSDSPLRRGTEAVIPLSSNVLDQEPTVQSSSTTGRAITGSVSQPKALEEVTQLTCIQKAKAWADPHRMSRNAIQRQNRVRQGVQHHSFHLQQPGHRNISH